MKEETQADPWRETDVIDKRAVRFSQGITAVMAFLGFFLSPLFWLLMGGQLLLGLFLGRRWCLPCLFYYLVLQPRFGEGELEDSRAPRFANIIGTLFLLGAFFFSLVGFSGVADGFALTVAFLASVASFFGICLGCLLYRFLARFRGIRSWSGKKVDLSDFSGYSLILFSHPLCFECQEWKKKYPEARVVDVSQEKDLAKKYGVLLVPTVYEIDQSGKIIQQLAP